MNYSELLQHEQLKRKLLLEKLRACEDRIKLLGSLASDTDEFDELIERQVLSVKPDVNVNVAPINNPSADVAFLSEAQIEKKDFPKLRRDSTWPKIVCAMGSGEANLDHLENIANANSMSMTRGSMRTLMMNLRKRGLVGNVKPGIYKLTQMGVEFVNAYKGEGDSARTESPSISNQASFGGGTESDGLL